MNCANFLVSVNKYFSVTGLITLLGFFILPPLTYYFVMKAYRLQQTISAYHSFKEVFIPTLQEIKRSDTSFIQIIQNHFPIHEHAMKTFVPKLEGKCIDRFNEKWHEYEETYEKWGNFKSSNPNAVFATNIQDMIEIAKNDSLPKGLRTDIQPLLNDDATNKKYLEYLILDLLDIAKQK